MSYDENASIKAQAFFDASGIAVVSDDTGLEVDALNGAPGCILQDIQACRVQRMRTGERNCWMP
jgi:inosine/xanthosine triphosphate pyrophosphatase family protein